MKKRLISLLLILVTVLGMIPAFAANTEDEALGAIDIYNGGRTFSYLSINGRVRSQKYTYYNYVSSSGQVKEIPAYCVNPTDYGVPQTVAEGESIEYLASEKASDPKVVGIIANGYPTTTLAQLGLDNKYQAYYATKMALWCYLISGWDINNLTVNPSLTGDELVRAEKMLAAAQQIYRRGTAWTDVKAPSVTCTPDQDVAYDVEIDGKAYKQQVFTFWSKTWICNYAVDVTFTDPDSVPEGTRIVDMDNKDITTITTSAVGDGYAGQFKVLYPAESVEGQTGNVQLSFSTQVYAHAVFYAVCAETDKYGKLQNYVVDTDPTTNMRLSAYSKYSDDGTPPDTPEDPEIPEVKETALKIVKYETGTTIPLEGAMFEVIDPDGATVGTFATNSNGEIVIPLTIVGNYTVIERNAPQYYLISEESAQNVSVVYGKTAEVVFENNPYGNLRVEKVASSGENLPGAVITVQHIESGQTYTATTSSAGVAMFTELQPGGYRIQEKTAPAGYIQNDTVYTTNVNFGETSVISIVNEEKPGLRIIKYDSKNLEVLPDITFEIFRDGRSIGEYKTNQLGEIVLTDLTPGTYLVQEVATDSTHIINSVPQQIELSGDMRQLIQRMEHRLCDNPVIEQNMIQLVQKLETTSGKKQYGYLPKPTKELVDRIVDELAKQPEVASCYEEWNRIRDELEAYYNETRVREHHLLSQQKEFRAIKNMVIREAEKIRLGIFTFEDHAIQDEPEPQLNPEQNTPIGAPHKHSEYEHKFQTIYEQVARYHVAKSVLQDINSVLNQKLASIAELKQLWDEGLTVAAHQLGKTYRDELTVLRDHKEAEQWFHRSAEAGNDYSEYALGKLLLSQHRYEEAIHWLTKAANQENQFAQYRLGKLYLTGEGVTKSVDTAIEYLTQSANQENQFAQYTLGKLFLLGKDVKQDKETAKEWLSRSAAQGNEYAKFFLERMDQFREPSVLLSATNLLRHMARIFRDNSIPPQNPKGIQMDSQRRQKLMDKRLAMGHKADDHEEQIQYQPTMTM